MTHKLEDVIGKAAPWTEEPGANGKPAQSKLAEHVTRATAPLLALAADALLEACVVALYLLFLLLEGSRFPDRVRRAYPPERAEEILDIAGQVSGAIISYLRAKVKSSLVIAIPVGIVLWLVGVKFALLWAILTFLCNFIPYIGSVIAYTFPVGFAFLFYGVRWEPITAAILLLLIHVGSASVVEPMIIGNAVGVSPLVILASLALWGFCGVSGHVPGGSAHGGGHDRHGSLRRHPADLADVEGRVSNGWFVGWFAIEFVCFQHGFAWFGSVSAKIRVVCGGENHSDRAFLAGNRIFRPPVPDPRFWTRASPPGKPVVFAFWTTPHRP